MRAMRTLVALLLSMGLAGAAHATDETPIGPGEFRDYAEGWTLHFERDGEFFGSEMFKPGGETRWRYRNGSCTDGVWRAHGAQICFLYDHDDEIENEVLCWRMLRDAEGMLALLLNGESKGLRLRITGRDKHPLLCGAPGLPI